jgi:phosphatidate cytidylyltransferase
MASNAGVGIGGPNGHPMEHLKRVVSAFVILPPLLLFLYFAPQELFLLFVILLVVLSLREYVQMLTLFHVPICPSVSYVIALLFVLVAYFGGERALPCALTLGLLALAVVVLCSPQYGAQRFPALLHSLFGVLFIGWTLSHLVLLRGLPEGKWYIFFLCIVVWVGDSVAMYVGKGLGRFKLAPAISPGKTWEGAVGGVLGGMLMAALAAHFLIPYAAFWQRLLLGLTISLVAQVSDLSESLIKRYVGVKDSGELIPGHGGMLDRIDSLLFTAPLLLYTLGMLFDTATP